MENLIENYLDLFINTSLNYTCIRFCIVSQPRNKLILNSKQLFNATNLLPITFGVVLPQNPRGKNQINPGTLDQNKNSKVQTIKIL